MFEFEIVVDKGETPNKCTITPLAYRKDFKIIPVPCSALTAEVLLHPQGQPLDEIVQKHSSIQRLAAIDCVWRRLEPILAGVAEPRPLLVSIPRGFGTAYPRSSKKDFDPDGGLATIEALFIAAAFLGCWDPSLLKEYFFADRFLELNEPVFCEYGIAAVIAGPVYQPSQPKNARTRRLGRGRF